MSANHMIAQYLGVVVAKSSLLFLGAAVMTLAMRRLGAAARHLVWIGAFVGAALLPVLGAIAPAWKVAILSTAPSPKAETRSLQVARVDDEKQIPRYARDDKQVPSQRYALDESATRNPRSTAVAGQPSLHIDALTVLLLVWAAGTLLLLSRLLFSVLSLRRLRRRAAAVADAEWER